MEGIDFSSAEHRKVVIIGTGPAGPNCSPLLGPSKYESTGYTGT